jgi:hypothetical protein
MNNIKENAMKSLVGTAILRNVARAVIGTSLVVITSGPVLAVCDSNRCEDERVLQIYTRADGNAYLQVSGAIANLDCTLVGGTYMTLLPSSPRFKEIYANLLAFQLAEKPISVRIVNGSQGCAIDYIYTRTP